MKPESRHVGGDDIDVSVTRSGTSSRVTRGSCVYVCVYGFLRSGVRRT